MHKTARRSHHNGNINADIEKIKAALADTTYDIKEKATEMLFQSLADAKEKSTAVKDNMSDYVTEKPFKSLGIALLTGLVVGYFIHK